MCGQGQPAIIKGLIYITLIVVMLVLFLLGTRNQLKLLERSTNTELWYTANSNISTYLQLSDRSSCKYCRNASNLCKIKDGGEVINFVTSYVRNTIKRHAIRDTWGASDAGSRPIFVMGISLLDSDMIAAVNEAQEYNDVIIENFIDTFENSTLKTAAVLKHFDRFCPNTVYLMKTEDDVFVNTNVVQNIVRRQTSNKRIHGDLPIIGYIFEEARVIRNARSLWYVGYTMFTERVYPTYASRSGYLLPGQSVKDILTKSIHIPMIPIEDAFFTGIVASRVGLNREMNMKFNWQPLTVNNHCVIRDRAIIYEPDPFKMYNLWRTLNDNHPTKCFNWYNSVMIKLFA